MQKTHTPASLNFNKEKRQQYHYVDTENSTGFTMQFRAINKIAELNCSSKLLFAEIFSLTYKFGYCFAKTEYFMNVLCLSAKKVQRCLAQLEKYGLIIRIRTYNKTTKTSQRYIYINMDLFEQVMNNSEYVVDFTEDEIMIQEKERLLNRIKTLKNSKKENKFSIDADGSIQKYAEFEAGIVF